ncbi:kinase-like domain-containing protein, partial [Mycena crocata]
VVVYDRPGSLSGNILRLHANIPWSLISRYLSGDPHVMIRDDDIYPIAKPLREFVGDDSPRKDTEDLVARLPLVAFDERIHFAKRSKFRSEIPNLLRANGLPHIVKLLGRTVDGRLVFPRLRPAPQLVSRTIGIAAVKRILLQLADAVLGLHAVGIIHRDLALRNILGSADFQTVYLCDLEGCWGSAECPEIAGASPASAAPYSEKSDVYMFGRLVTDFILRNSPWTRWQCLPGGNWLPPAPFRAIVLACLEVEPHARPDMHQVKAMLQAI